MNLLIYLFNLLGINISKNFLIIPDKTFLCVPFINGSVKWWGQNYQLILSLLWIHLSCQ